MDNACDDHDVKMDDMYGMDLWMFVPTRSHRQNDSELSGTWCMSGVAQINMLGTIDEANRRGTSQHAM